MLPLGAAFARLIASAENSGRGQTGARCCTGAASETCRCFVGCEATGGRMLVVDELLEEIGEGGLEHTSRNLPVANSSPRKSTRSRLQTRPGPSLHPASCAKW